MDHHERSKVREHLRESSPKSNPPPKERAILCTDFDGSSYGEPRPGQQGASALYQCMHPFSCLTFQTNLAEQALQRPYI